MNASQQRAEFIRSISIFANLPEPAIEEIAARATQLEVAAGEWLFRAGDSGEALYALQRGRLEVIREAGDVDVPIRPLGPGAVLGELAVLTRSKRSASVRARRDSILLELSSEAFLGLLEDDPELARGLAQALALQLQASRAVTIPSEPVPPVIALVPATADVEIGVLADQLAAEMGQRSAVKQLRREEAIAEEGFGAALDRWERSGDQVLLVADRPTGDDWSAFCLRQADRVVAVAGQGAPGAVDPAMAGSDLALLDWPDHGRLADWTRALDPRAVHPVRAGEDRAAAIAPLARRLSGGALGAVLSGGGARGLAHIGVLDTLIAADVTIDRVAGCSMGALVGALFAAGLEPREIHRRLREELVEGKPISDYTVPLAGLIRGRRAEAMLLRLFGDLRIEELEREYFCVSCDLVSSDLIVHRRGPVYEAVGASMCLPGIAPPVVSGERLLVDGGVLNNLPVETMAGRGEGPVVAVDVTSRFEPPARQAGGAARPRLRRISAAARRAVIGWENPLPTFRETLTRTIVLGSIDTAEAAQRHADVVIPPAVQGIGLMEFDRIDEICAQGSAAAREVLERRPPALRASLSGGERP